jgi:hypothetical protein
MELNLKNMARLDASPLAAAETRRYVPGMNAEDLAPIRADGHVLPMPPELFVPTKAGGIPCERYAFAGDAYVHALGVGEADHWCRLGPAAKQTMWVGRAVRWALLSSGARP